MPRLIRRRPLAERIRAYLDPADFLLWLSEELETSDWDQWQRDWAIPIGILLNLVFLIARANSGYSQHTIDDVFGDDFNYSSWTSWFASFVVHFLSLLSFLNAFYTFYRHRHYRLFESDVDDIPSTPSAHRVRVDSSPVSSSPLRFLSNIIAGESSEARSHPDATRDVWEIAVWDPTPLSLRMFCLLSPGHVLVYWLLLPAAISDPRPSVTVLTTVILGVVLSTQLYLLQSNFSQQSKDSSIIHKEVMNEYDTKYVHPRTQPLMRDVGTQFSLRYPLYPPTAEDSQDEDEPESVDTYTPTFILNRGFHTRPNPNYIKHLDPDRSQTHRPPTRNSNSNSSSSNSYSTTAPYETPAHLRDISSPIRPQTAIRQPQFRHTATGGGGGDGGSLGIYSHAKSPLKKGGASTGVGVQERGGSPAKREGSPLKRGSLAPNGGVGNGSSYWGVRDGGVRRESGRF